MIVPLKREIQLLIVPPHVIDRRQDGTMRKYEADEDFILQTKKEGAGQYQAA